MKKLANKIEILKVIRKANLSKLLIWINFFTVWHMSSIAYSLACIVCCLQLGICRIVVYCLQLGICSLLFTA